MVGRRDQGGMTIWWSSSVLTHTHPSQRVSPTRSVTLLHARISGSDVGRCSAGLTPSAVGLQL